MNTPVEPTDPNNRFRPRARLLQLLGDQLIGNPRLAIFELVKNAYDADASQATVTMSHLTTKSASIEVADDGFGMSVDTIRDIWLVPGHDHKAVARASNERTPLGRLPLGEKGVGRFAVHKLGHVIELVTRSAGNDEVVVRIDWDDVGASEYLDQAEIDIRTRPPERFTNNSTGTYVKVTALAGPRWTRGEVRRLARQITSISSPFSERDGTFSATLELPDQSKWLENLPDTDALLGAAPWVFTFSLEGNTFAWHHEFRGVPGVPLERRVTSGKSEGLLIDPRDLPAEDEPAGTKAKRPKTIVSTPDLADQIGPLRGRLYVYDRDKDVLGKIGFSSSLQEFLNESGGMRVYRDKIRVYNYGEPGDDWLGLDIRRVNSPSKRISNNIVVGAVDLDLEKSTGLVEKTNREGFVDGVHLARLRALLRGAIAVFEAERNKDKNNLRDLLRKQRTELRGGIERPLQQIRTLARKNDLSASVDPLLAKAQRAYDNMREIMLRAGTSGMSLVIVYHEIEHGVRLLHNRLRSGAPADSVIQQTSDLVAVLDSFGDMLRRGESGTHDLRALAQRAADLNSVRASNHSVELVVDTNDGDSGPAPIAEFPLGLVLGAVTNLIDNSIYWLRARWTPDSDGVRRILLSVDTENFSGPALIVADNGAGFMDELEDAVAPFFTRRPDGIGVGLYYVNLIMETIGGSLQMVDREISSVGDTYDGAALALVFKRG